MAPPMQYLTSDLVVGEDEALALESVLLSDVLPEARAFWFRVVNFRWVGSGVR